MLLSLLSLDRERFLSMVRALAGLFLAWEAIVCAVMLIVRPEESIFITGNIFPPLGGIALIYLNSSSVIVDFQDGVRMGRTRRQMLGLTLKMCALQTALISALCGLLIFLEYTVFFQLWGFLAGRPGAILMKEAPGGGQMWEPIWDTGVLRIENFSFLPGWVLPLLLLGGALAGFFLGALGQRFGARLCFWFPLAIYWGLFLLPRMLPDTYEEAAAPLQVLLVLLLLAGGALWGIWSLLHAVIRE